MNYDSVFWRLFDAYTIKIIQRNIANQMFLFRRIGFLMTKQFAIVYDAWFRTRPIASIDAQILAQHEAVFFSGSRDECNI